MAKIKQDLSKKKREAKPKKTRQGASANTKHSATASNRAKKPYRGQGK